MSARPSVYALNHLLGQNSWALPRLARFAGKTVRFDIAPLSFAYSILHDGTLDDTTASADAVCAVAPSFLPRLALNDEKALADIRTEGDAELLAEIFFLTRNLRWDAAEDLSLFTGDIVAERIVQAAQTTRLHLRDAISNLAQAATEYCTEERPVLATQRQLVALAQQVDTLRADAARLEQRIQIHSASACVSEA
jgi:ubiquinone biosynthesis protein UbiJ